MEILNCYVSRGRRTASRIIGKTTVVLLLPKDNRQKDDPLFELGLAGTFFWKLLEENPRVKVVVDRFIKEYAVERKEALRQVVRFIRDCRSKHLVEISKRPGNRGKPWLT